MVPPPWRFHDALIKQQEIRMTTTRELCRLLSATLHLPGVHRWAEQLGSRELLPGLDHEVDAIDAAVVISIALQHGIPAAALTKSIGRLPAGPVTPADLEAPRPGRVPASPIGAALDLVSVFERKPAE
jgi:hypothetical protein